MVLLPLTLLCSLLSFLLALSNTLALSNSDHALEVEFHSGGVAGVEVRVQVVLPQDLRNELVAAAATRPLSRLEEAAEPQVSARDFHLSLHSAVFPSLIALPSCSPTPVKRVTLTSERKRM